MIAPALFRTEQGGRLLGGSIFTVNAVRGAQIGVINIVRHNPSSRRVLPIINLGRDR